VRRGPKFLFLLLKTEVLEESTTSVDKKINEDMAAEKQKRKVV
jgi:hypothetical protein